jgi:DNA-binding CsgD family transcriptional regulator/GAF domain-containing protein
MGSMTARRQVAERLSGRVIRECARAQDPLRLLERVATLVRAEIPYAVAGWLLVDPETMLINGVHAESVSREQHIALIECELAEDDVNKFYDLASRPVPAASLSAATEGDLSRSLRWRRVYQPCGYGDELRAVFATGSTAWGHACLTRRASEPFFSVAEVALVAAVCPHIGHGIRTSLLLSGVAPDIVGAGPPALVVLADDGSVESMSAEARDWLGSIDDEGLESTIVLHEVAQQSRVLARDGAGRIACARTRSRSGDWLVVRGARLEGTSSGVGRTALVLEQARRSDIAPVLMRLRQLTDREREVTQLLLTGMPTDAIARKLWISPETLRGHVKAVFAKLDVNSRPQLAALLSHEPVVSSSSSIG